MKKQLLLMTAALLVGLVPVGAEEHTEMENQMEAVDEAFKGFRRETDPVKGAAQAREAQNASLKAAAEIPKLVKAMPEGPEKAKAAAEYRKMMGKLFVTFCEVEEAFLAGKTEEVANIVKSIRDMKEAGHEKFMEEEK